MVEVARIKSGNAVLAAEIAGVGAPVIFLHAAVADRRMWRDTAAQIAATHRAIAYDRRGFGETTAPVEDHSAVDDLRRVLDTQTEKAVLVGCSQGGRIVIDAALRFPERVRAIVLIAPSVTGGPDPVYPASIAPLMAIQPAAIELKARLWLDGALSAENRVTGAARAAFVAMNETIRPAGKDIDVAPNYDRLAEIALPTLVLCGDLDFPHIQARCRHLAATLPRANLKMLPGLAHLPSLEAPDAVAGPLAEFLAAR
jgi:pimeloyl-ACP methyl ester carboxylesterase